MRLDVEVEAIFAYRGKSLARHRYAFLEANGAKMSATRTPFHCATRRGSGHLSHIDLHDNSGRLREAPVGDAGETFWLLQSSRRPVVIATRAARVAGNSPPTNPIAGAHLMPFQSRSGETSKANTICPEAPAVDAVKPSKIAQATSAPITPPRAMIKPIAVPKRRFLECVRAPPAPWYGRSAAAV